MTALKMFVIILVAFIICQINFLNVDAAPLKRYDQRQDGDLNIQAHLDKIVLLIVPSKNINILDIKGQGQFESYDDILPLISGKDNSINEVKFKSATVDEKKPSITIVQESKDDKKEIEIKEDKPEKKDQKQEIIKEAVKQDTKKLPVESKEAFKKAENDSKTITDTQKKISVLPKTDGRTYQTLLSGNNKDRVVAVHEEVRKTDLPVTSTKVEKL